MPKGWPDDATDENWKLTLEVGKLKEEINLLRVQKLLWYGAAEELAEAWFERYGEYPGCIETPREMDPDA